MRFGQQAAADRLLTHTRFAAVSLTTYRHTQKQQHLTCLCTQHGGDHIKRAQQHSAHSCTRVVPVLKVQYTAHAKGARARKALDRPKQQGRCCSCSTPATPRPHMDSKPTIAMSASYAGACTSNQASNKQPGQFAGLCQAKQATIQGRVPEHPERTHSTSSTLLTLLGQRPHTNSSVSLLHRRPIPTDQPKGHRKPACCKHSQSAEKKAGTMLKHTLPYVPANISNRFTSHTQIHSRTHIATCFYSRHWPMHLLAAADTSMLPQ